MLDVAIGSLPLLLLEFDRPTLSHSDRIFLDAVNLVVLGAFATGYAVELALAGRRLIAGMTMVVGISTFAVVTAKVAEFLVRADKGVTSTD